MRSLGRAFVVVSLLAACTTGTQNASLTLTEAILDAFTARD